MYKTGSRDWRLRFNRQLAIQWSGRSEGGIYCPHMENHEIEQLLGDLVAIPSVNRMGREGRPSSSRRMLEHLETWLDGRGLESRRQGVPGGEENLTVHIGPTDGPTILFDAHTDTVPADGWEQRAFVPQVDGGRLYGRGSCDTKASMAAMLAALAAAALRGTLPHQIVFAATADEEYLRTGVTALLDSGLRPDLAIVGEPTRLEPVVACKGIVRWEIVIPGRTAHSSRPSEGVNAIARLKEVLAAIDRYNETIAGSKRHPLVNPASLTPTVVRGGNAPNVVPCSCELLVDLRTMPDEDPEAAALETQKFLSAQCPFPLEHLGEQVWGGADVPTNHPLAQRCLRSCRNLAPAGREVELRGANYGCHASDYAARGIPAVVIGPGDIRFAHAVDEYVELDEVFAAAKIYFDLMTQEL